MFCCSRSRPNINIEAESLDNPTNETATPAAAPKSQCSAYASIIAATFYATVTNAFCYNSVANISHEIVNFPGVPELNKAKQWEIKTFAMLTPVAIASAALIANACCKTLCCLKNRKDSVANVCNTISLLVPTTFAAIAATPYLLNPLNKIVNDSGYFTDFDISGHLTMKLITAPLVLATCSHLKLAGLSKTATLVAVGVLATDVLFLAQTNAYHHQPAEMIAAGVVGTLAMGTIATFGATIYSLASSCCSVKDKVLPVNDEDETVNPPPHPADSSVAGDDNYDNATARSDMYILTL